jgi:hypothetical protein
MSVTTVTDVAGIVDALSPAQTVALTLWAEARARLEPRRGWVANPIDAMADVANVIVNRTRDRRWRRLGFKGTCLARAQFSCWLPAPPRNDDALMRRARELLAGRLPTDVLLDCLALADACLDGRTIDRLHGATHYYATWIAPPAWTRPPARFVAERYGQRFYAGVA